MLIRAEARGKINWALAVTGRREDGYHTLDMLLQSVTLEDGLEILPAESLTLQVSGPQRVTAGENNLILKAAALLAERTGCRRGAFFKLTKRVPMGAGMGVPPFDVGVGWIHDCRDAMHGVRIPGARTDSPDAIHGVPTGTQSKSAATATVRRGQRPV